MVVEIVVVVVIGSSSSSSSSSSYIGSSSSSRDSRWRRRWIGVHIYFMYTMYAMFDEDGTQNIIRQT